MLRRRRLTRAEWLDLAEQAEDERVQLRNQMNASGVRDHNGFTDEQILHALDLLETNARDMAELA